MQAYHVDLIIFFGFVLVVIISILDRFKNDEIEKVRREEVSETNKIKLLEVNTKALQVQNQRLKDDLPLIKGVDENYQEVAKKLHQWSIFSPPVLVSTVEPQQATNSSSDTEPTRESIPIPDVLPAQADSVDQYHFTPQAKVAIAYFSDFDLYHCLLVIGNRQFEMGTYIPAVCGMEKDDILKKVIKEGREKHAEFLAEQSSEQAESTVKVAEA